jgi:hypothetical protein
MWFPCRSFNIFCFACFFGFLPLVLLFFLSDEADLEVACAYILETKEGASRLKIAHMM